MSAWVIRAWEPEPPAGEDALEWRKVTTVPVQTGEQAWQRVRWYRWRWLAQDFRHRLKTAAATAQRGSAVATVEDPDSVGLAVAGTARDCADCPSSPSERGAPCEGAPGSCPPDQEDRCRDERASWMEELVARRSSGGFSPSCVICVYLSGPGSPSGR